MILTALGWNRLDGQRIELGLEHQDSEWKASRDGTESGAGGGGRIPMFGGRKRRRNNSIRERQIIELYLRGS